MPRRLKRTPALDGKPYGLRRKAESHPNQWTANPKQELWIKYYLDPVERETFGNAYQAALKAGYTDSYSKKIAQPSVANDWVKNSSLMVKLGPDHVIAGIQREAIEALQSKDRLKALELLAKLQGMLVDRQLVGHVNIEQAVQELR